MNKKYKVKRRTPIVKQLNKKFGGKWKYVPFQSIWLLENSDAMACYVADGGYDMDGNYQPVPHIFKKLTIYGLKDGVQYLHPR